MTRIVLHLLFAASSLLAADALDHTKWTVRAAQPAELWPKSARGTLTFDGGRASFSGCNMTTGKYEIKDARLSAQFLMSTKRACQPELETASQNFIAGFTPRPGIEYRVRIKEDSGPSGPVCYHDMTVEQKVIKR